VVERLATEQALRRSEVYFHSLIDNSFDVVVVLDPDGTIRLESGSMHRTFGYEPSEVLGRCYFDFVHPDDIEPVRRGLDAALQGGTSTFECRLRRKDGAWLTCELASTSVLTPEGRQVLVFNVHDVTERTKAQQQQAFLGSIVESARIAIIGITQDGKIASWNRAAESAYGYTASEILGQPFATLLVEGEEPSDELLARVKRGERTGLHEALRRRKDGQIVPLSVNQSPILDKAGAVVGVASIERSASEETRLQQQLQEAHAYTRGLIESSLDAMLMVGSDLIITDANEQTLKLTGTTRDAIIGSRFDSYFTDPGHAAQAIRRTLSERYVTNYELALKPVDGRQVLVSFNTSVFRDAAGQPSGVFAVGRDVTQQRELERDLRQAQAYTSGLIESSLDAMLTVDHDLVIMEVNEQMAKMTEMPKTMLIGSRFDKCFTDPQRAAAGVEQTLKEGFVTNYDLAIQTPTGREILVSFNASTFYDTLGSIQGVFVVARDVTEQRRTEQRLRDQQDYSRALIESSLDALLAIDGQLNIIDVNDKSVQLTGYSREELLRSSLPSLFTDADLATEAARKALSESVKDCELTIRTADGADVPVSFNASQFRDAQGKVRGVFATARDIGERQRLERERSLLASIVTSSEDAIYSETTDGIVNSWNGGAEKLFGYSAQEIVGRNATVCIPLEHRVESLEHLRRVLRKEGIQQFETVRRRKDGSVVGVSTTMSPIIDKAGRVSGIALIARDITQRWHFEDELTKARDEALEGARLKSEFLANMSHEIRTPLNSLIGLGRMLLDTRLSAEQQALLREMRENTDGLLAILNDILDFSKMSAGKLLFEQVDFELERVIAAALSLLAARAKEGAGSGDVDRTRYAGDAQGRSRPSAPGTRQPAEQRGQVHRAGRDSSPGLQGQ
jgi:PAS domain S-box-containing protein